MSLRTALPTCPSLAVLALALVWLPGCGDGGPELVEVSIPDTGALGPAAREQIETARELALAEGRGDGVAWGNLGLTCHAYDFLLAAATAYENAATLAPEEPDWRYLRGRVLEALGRPDEAEREFAAAAFLAPEDLRILLGRARVNGELGRFVEAGEAARAALDLVPNDPEALLLAGRSELESGDAAAAVEYLERLFVSQPRAAPVVRELARAYSAWGRPELADELLTREATAPLVTVDPLQTELEVIRRNLPEEFERGLEAASAEELEDAARSFVAVLAQNPDNNSARMNLGTIRARQGRADQARLAFEEILRRDPEHLEARFNLGVLEARTGDDEAALVAFRRARTTAPDDPKLRFAAGGALYRLGRCEEALEEYRRAIEVEPVFELARMGEAVCRLALGRFGEAAVGLEEGLTVIPDSTGLAALQARLLAAAPEAELRDGARALALARSLVDENRTLEHVEIWAMALAETGDPEQAAELQQEILETAERTGRVDLEARLVANLSLYRAGRPCRDPSL